MSEQVYRESSKKRRGTPDSALEGEPSIKKKKKEEKGQRPSRHLGCASTRHPKHGAFTALLPSGGRQHCHFSSFLLGLLLKPFSGFSPEQAPTPKKGMVFTMQEGYLETLFPKNEPLSGSSGFHL